MNKNNKKDSCECPYCENELEMKCFEPVFCVPCGKKFLKCPKCGKLFNEKEKTCPHCS
ncbi:MAG: hypothetical protein LHV68_13485 [Elusimicrobia bacterium]|nr:hypothetical protein [Candidatus Liberimonas magnetica]